MTPPQNRRLMTTSRQELDVELQVISGQIPQDIYGHFFVVYPAGNVNSPLPLSEFLPDGSPNPDYGSPIMNGDGMVMRIDFDKPGQAFVKSRLMKTPCFYVDEASKFGTEDYHRFRFENHGIVRMSRVMGARNEANTAIIPVRFKGQETTSLLIAYDCGKPWFFDPVELKVLNPIGYNSEWHDGMPDIFREVFPMIETTAHPVFDPYTQELFSVNFTKSNKNTFSSFFLERLFTKDEEYIQTELNLLKHKIQGATNHAEASDHLEDFLKKIETEATTLFRTNKFLGFIGKAIDKVLHFIWAPFNWLKKEFDNGNHFFLIRFDGNQPMKKWEVFTEDGQPLEIRQCMHQITLNKDFILLVDTSFKFSLDLLLKNPVTGNQTIEKLLREIMAIPMIPFCDTYIIDRRNLKDDQQTVTAKKLRTPLPLETVHFNSTYNAEDGKMDLFCIHNSAVCIAEWIRPYDVNQLTGQPVNKDYVGMFSIGDMDISRLGVYRIDCEKAEVEKETIFYKKGKPAGKGCGANTWGIGLISYPDILSATNIPSKFKYVWYMANGPDPNMLTKFIYAMYEKYPNRIIPIEEVLEFNKAGLPFVFNRYNVETNAVDDYFELPEYTYLRAHYFIPSSDSSKDEYDGYLCTTLQVGEMADEGNMAFHNEVWIFDAKNISQGPVCKMTHPELEFCFQLHSAWLPEIAPHHLGYKVNVKQDIEQSISRLFLPWHRSRARKFMAKHVYPHFA